MTCEGSGAFYTFTVYKSAKANENAATLTYMYDAAPEAARIIQRCVPEDGNLYAGRKRR